jgi:hypothetical protein
MPRKREGKEGGDGGSGAQKRGPAPSPPDAVGDNKKTSTPSTSDRSTKTKTTNLNLAQGTTVDALRTATSYFDKGWNAFAQQKDGSIQWIPEQIVGIAEDFHSQEDGTVKMTYPSGAGALQLLFIFIGKIYVRRGRVPTLYPLILHAPESDQRKNYTSR